MMLITKQKKVMKKSEKFKLILFIILVLTSLFILIRPCSIKPFSNHDCYCEGFKKTAGKYPISCTH